MSWVDAVWAGGFAGTLVMALRPRPERVSLRRDAFLSFIAVLVPVGSLAVVMGAGFVLGWEPRPADWLLRVAFLGALVLVPAVPVAVAQAWARDVMPRWGWVITVGALPAVLVLVDLAVR